MILGKLLRCGIGREMIINTDSGYDDFTEGDSISETVSGFIAEAQKYEENK